MRSDQLLYDRRYAVMNDKNANKDIFDKLMSLPILNIFEPFYRKHKEVLLYLFFGGIAFFLNLGFFILFNSRLGINELVTNVVCWIICVLFQFFTNRIWVFKTAENVQQGFLKQMAIFFGGRIFTLVIEEIILAIFITWLGFNSFAVKMAAQVIVNLLNYIISKKVVFRYKK